MKVVKAGWEVIPDCGSVTKKIERIARVCYKSEDMIGEGTDLVMLNKLVERQHYAMLEHASLVYVVPEVIYRHVKALWNECRTEFQQGVMAEEMSNNVRMNFTDTIMTDTSTRYIVSANLRGWLEFFEYCRDTGSFSVVCNGRYLMGIVESVKEQTKGVIDFTDYLVGVGESFEEVQLVTSFDRLTTPERMIHETFSVLFTVDRGVTHEIVRMRDCSFAQESTRYCNYSAGKYGNEITVIKPCFWEEGSDEYRIWVKSCEDAELAYITLTERCKSPAQQARDVLPQSVKADIVVTTNLHEWRHILDLRACDATGPAHPQMKEVMCPLCTRMQEFYPFAFEGLEVKSL